MESAKCNVIYVDHNVRNTSELTTATTASELDAILGESGELRANLSLLIKAFGEVHACATGTACVEKLLNLHDTSSIELKPTLVLIETPQSNATADTEDVSRGHSPHSRGSSDATHDISEHEMYGLRLLEKLVYETHSRNLTKLVVPIPVVAFPLLQSSPRLDGSNMSESGEFDYHQSQYTEYLNQSTDQTGKSLTSRALLRKCLDSGAVDVLASPIHVKALTTLEVHAYRAHKEALREQQALLEIRRGRKRSWVGVNDEQPFAYLREAMVSSLMGGICRSGDDSDVLIGSVRISVSSEQKAGITEAIGKWHFCAHEFNDDQLLIAASLIFKHALAMPELEPWRIPTDQLTKFLVSCRAAYNTFVPYHNFRHAVDVLQATFSFLLHMGALPPYPLDANASIESKPKTPLGALLKPFDALTLLISAIGHDVGHPGVNNGFLVTLNAPLAQLYNDRSVLESFHCAAYSQILRRYWPSAFENTKMRNLMISSILATDMGLHFDYMGKLAMLQKKLQENNSTDDWNSKTIDVETALICALLIKCADISNVARRYDAALKWMHILCDEFSRQASMENEIGIASSLISEPKKDFLSLAKAQLGFMNLFAIPLFQGVADILPCMKYTVDELNSNKALFETAIEDFPTMDEQRKKVLQEGTVSAHSMEVAATVPESQDSSSGTTLDASIPMSIEMPDNHAEMKNAGSSPPDQSQQIPNVLGEYRELNGVLGDFDHVARFAASDPFNIAEDGENTVIGHSGKQRHSETTDGSNSAPYSGDWASQATSATTGKMPLSPSTQGTSIISQESVERPSSGVPVTMVTAPESHHLGVPLPEMESTSSYDEHSNDSTIKLDGSPGSDRSPSSKNSLRKKPSRFRMNALKLFRRDKRSHSPSGENGG